MTRQDLFNIKIDETEYEIYKGTKKQWDHLSKPIDGMGDFEEIVCRIAAIQKTVNPVIADRTLFVFCSDNGIVSRGVTQSGQDVTKKVAEALGSGKSTACMLANNAKTKVIAIDIGINCDDRIEGVIDKKIAKGTKDFLTEPAMTEDELLQAIETGITLVNEEAESGTKLIATGEMGIGNTTTSAAVLSALLRIDSDEIVGRGAGLDDDKLENKRQVVRAGLDKYRDIFVNAIDDSCRCFEILRCLGGFDIAAMCGVFLGGAIYGIPVLMDGVISAVAALAAERIAPGTRQYMIASHSGREKGTGLVLNELGLKASINGDMALGEGTGALMMIPLIDSALYLYDNGMRFSEAGIEDYERFN